MYAACWLPKYECRGTQINQHVIGFQVAPNPTRQVDEGRIGWFVLTIKMQATNRSGEGGREPAVWPRIWVTTREDVERGTRAKSINGMNAKKDQKSAQRDRKIFRPASFPLLLLYRTRYHIYARYVLTEAAWGVFVVVPARTLMIQYRATYRNYFWYGFSRRVREHIILYICVCAVDFLVMRGIVFAPEHRRQQFIGTKVSPI